MFRGGDECTVEATDVQRRRQRYSGGVECLVEVTVELEATGV